MPLDRRRDPATLALLMDNSPKDQDRSSPTQDAPRFGRLLLVLIGVVLLIAVITFASEAYFSA
jgi:hypothetical protein